jgi:hypothetical protein
VPEADSGPFGGQRTHDPAGCRRELPGLAAPTASRADGAAATLVSSVSPAPLVLAAAASPSGSGGNFAAEPVSEADAWVTGGSSGAFSHSCPINVPPVPGGLEPHVSLDYRSQAITGAAMIEDRVEWLVREVKDLLDVSTVGLYEFIWLLRSKQPEITLDEGRTIAELALRQLLSSRMGKLTLLTWMPRAAPA